MGVRNFVRDRKQVRASKASMNGDAGKLAATKMIANSKNREDTGRQRPPFLPPEGDQYGVSGPNVKVVSKENN